MKILYLACLLVMTGLSGNRDANADTPIIAAAIDKIIPADADVTDTNLISLGPIGVRVETDHKADRHPRSNSNSGIVRYIFENSLAQGKLKIGDEIIGVNGRKFKQNFTALMAKEIDKSEGANGRLRIEIKRNNKSKTIKFTLKKIGSYSKTWPYKCKKSSKILSDACDWLVLHQQPNGRIEKNPRQSCLVLSSVTGLALLGCDEKKYRRQIEGIASFLTNWIQAKTDSDGHFDGGTLDLWSVNYSAIFLAEYYLKTKDKRVLTTLEFLNKEIYYRQFHQLEPAAKKHMTTHLVENKGLKTNPVPDYWFAHGKVDTKSNGYIHLGVNVANACVAWSLLEKAGVDVDSENLTATLDYVEKACVSGAMGYAARLNQRATPSDAFGRTGALGVALLLRNDRKAYTNTVTESLVKQYPANYYFSHATAVMGKAWGTIALANLDPKQFRVMMNDMKQDFDLLRLSDGSFVSNPAKANRHGELDMKNGGSSEKHRWTTAFNALIYTLAEGNLEITKKPY